MSGVSRKAHMRLMIIMLSIMTLFVFSAMPSVKALAEGEEGAAETAEEAPAEMYQGITNREIRVRTGPGTEYDQVVVDGKLLYLPVQTECLIIGQDVASNGKYW